MVTACARSPLGSSPSHVTTTRGTDATPRAWQARRAQRVCHLHRRSRDAEDKLVHGSFEDIGEGCARGSWETTSPSSYDGHRRTNPIAGQWRGSQQMRALADPRASAESPVVHCSPGISSDTPTGRSFGCAASGLLRAHCRSRRLGESVTYHPPAQGRRGQHLVTGVEETCGCSSRWARSSASYGASGLLHGRDRCARWGTAASAPGEPVSIVNCEVIEHSCPVLAGQIRASPSVTYTGSPDGRAPFTAAPRSAP